MGREEGNHQPVTRLKVLGAVGIAQIHQAVLQVMEYPGVRVHDDEAHRLLVRAGARPAEDNFITFSSRVIDNGLRKLPTSLRLYDRNGSVALDTANRRPYFATGLFCANILDHRNCDIRPFLLEDVREAALLSDRLDNIHLLGSLGLPSDVPAGEAPLRAINAVMQESSKPLFFYGNDLAQSSAIWELIAGQSGGWARLTEAPTALDLIGPTSPLTLDSQACQRLVFNARRGLPTVCFSAVIPGVSGPVTLAGALVQASAESLAGIILHQAAGPGAPIISGSNVLTMDLRSGNIAYAAPEYSVVCEAAAEYFAYLGIPTWVGGGHSDAHRVDGQAAAEAGMGLAWTALSSSRLIHNLGYLSSGKTASLEMLVLGDELANAVIRLSKGIQVDEPTLAVELIRQQAVEGDFLTSPHTLQHCRQEFSSPELFIRKGLEDWQNEGSSDLTDRIKAKIDTILS